MVPTQLPVLSFLSKAAFETWLAGNHSSAPGLWLKIGRKDSGHTTVDYAQALEVALCYGWIDGQKDKFDEGYWLQRFTPRGPRSKWSKINRDKAEALVASGAMRPAGQAQIDSARADGRWDAAYAGAKSATVPEDLAAALAANPAAHVCFSTLDSRNRYAILYRVQDAKKPETRARRVAQYVEMLAEGRKSTLSVEQASGSRVYSSATGSTPASVSKYRWVSPESLPTARSSPAPIPRLRPGDHRGCLQTVTQPSPQVACRKTSPMPQAVIES